MSPPVLYVVFNGATGRRFRFEDDGIKRQAASLLFGDSVALLDVRLDKSASEV